jgi:hypothetical protein
MKPFSAWSADIRKQPFVMSWSTKRRGRWQQPEKVKMRTISFILACAFVLAGASVAGSSDQGLPGVGTFAYNGSPSTVSAQPIVVAAK